MLGCHIRAFRKRKGISLKALSESSGIDEETLRQLEIGDIRQIDNKRLLRITDALQLNSAFEFAGLFHMNTNPVKFKMYVIGLFRTGTTSVARTLRHLKSAHEHNIDEVKKTVRLVHDGRLTRQALIEFLRRRHYLAGLEVDSAHFHRCYLDILATEFPCASFVVLVRDCYSWLDSVLNWFLNNRLGNINEDWRFTCGIDGFRCLNEAQTRREFEQHIEDALKFWTSAYSTIITALPIDRSLILGTHEISGRLSELADFLGIEEESLDLQAAHSSSAPKKYNILSTYDRTLMEERFDKHCGRLMAHLFPGYSFRDYLDGRDPPRPALLSREE